MLGIFHPLQTEILGRSVTSHTLRIEDCLVRPKGRIVRVLHVEQLALELRGIMSAKRTGNGDAGALGEHGIAIDDDLVEPRSEEHTSELQSLIRISYAVF